MESKNPKRAAQSQFNSSEQSFLLVTNGTDSIEQDLKAELTRKKITPPGYMKKWLDVAKLFEQNYNCGAVSLEAMLQFICDEWEGIPHVDDAKNICKIVAVVIGDCPGKIIANVP